MRILVMGIDEIDDNLFYPCNDSGPELNKPPFGTCLYGSTMRRDEHGCVNSEWTEFTQYDFTDKYFKHGISFTLKKNSKIIEIDTVDDYRKVLQKYKWTDNYSVTKHQIDFHKLSKDYDAFHLTSNAFWSMKTPFNMNDDDFDFLYGGDNADFYAYDCETWILFNLDCINRASILNHNNIMCNY